jgi:hypothetical protein
MSIVSLSVAMVRIRNAMSEVSDFLFSSDRGRVEPIRVAARQVLLRTKMFRNAGSKCEL